MIAASLAARETERSALETASPIPEREGQGEGQRGGLCAARHYPAQWGGIRIPSGGWAVCALSLFMLSLNGQLGSPAAALFMLPWGWIVLRNPGFAFVNLARYAPLFILPVFALLSASWSQFPEASLRAAFQFLVTTMIAILAGACINPRTLLPAALSALTSIMVSGVVLDGGASFRGECALTGVFSSKNQFAFHAVIQLLLALAVLFDKAQSTFARLVALFALVMAPICLVAAQSLGAIAFCIPAVAALLGLKMTGRLPLVGRAAAVAGILTAGVALLISAANFADDSATLLDMLGKDSTLTGRTYLWQRGRDFIAEAPVLGAGYQAFWLVGNPPAEELWSFSFEESGAGFNFHNLYINTAVELGYAGVALLIAMLLWLAFRILRAIVLNPSPLTHFAAAVFVYFISTSFIEVSLLYQFHLGTILFGVMWVYSGDAWRRARQRPERHKARSSGLGF